MFDQKMRNQLGRMKRRARRYDDKQANLPTKINDLPRQFIIQMYSNLLQREINKPRKIVQTAVVRLVDLAQEMERHQNKHNQFLKPFIKQIESIYRQMLSFLTLPQNLKYDDENEIQDFLMETDYEQVLYDVDQNLEQEDWDDGQDYNDWDCEEYDSDQLDVIDDEVVDLLHDIKQALVQGFGLESNQPRDNKIDTIIDLLEQMLQINKIDLTDYPNYKQIDVNWEVDKD